MKENQRETARNALCHLVRPRGREGTATNCPTPGGREECQASMAKVQAAALLRPPKPVSKTVEAAVRWSQVALAQPSPRLAPSQRRPQQRLPLGRPRNTPPAAGSTSWPARAEARPPELAHPSTPCTAPPPPPWPRGAAANCAHARGAPDSPSRSVRRTQRTPSTPPCLVMAPQTPRRRRPQPLRPLQRPRRRRRHFSPPPASAAQRRRRCSPLRPSSSMAPNSRSQR